MRSGPSLGFHARLLRCCMTATTRGSVDCSCMLLSASVCRKGRTPTRTTAPPPARFVFVRRHIYWKHDHHPDGREQLGHSPRRRVGRPRHEAVWMCRTRTRHASHRPRAVAGITPAEAQASTDKLGSAATESAGTSVSIIACRVRVSGLTAQPIKRSRSWRRLLERRLAPRLLWRFGDCARS